MPFFRLRITCFLEIHMDVGTPWLISVTLMEVHLLLRMPYRCVELKKWLIEWLEELSNKVVNNSYKIKISFELFLYKSQFLFWIWIIIFQKVSYHWNLQEQVKKAFYFENILIVDFEMYFLLVFSLLILLLLLLLLLIMLYIIWIPEIHYLNLRFEIKNFRMNAYLRNDFSLL